MSHCESHCFPLKHLSLSHATLIIMASFPSFRGGLRRPAAADATVLEPHFPRLVERNLPFDQSKNKVHITHRHSRHALYKLLSYNWFHVFLRLPTKYSLLLLLALWTFLILFFALLYYLVDGSNPNLDCGLGNAPPYSISYGGAFAFALETCTTVGYGLPGGTNAFFENCPAIQTVIYFQMVLSMMSNAFLFAFFFARLAKSESRAVQVVFSEKCVVRSTDTEKVVLQFRVYDVDASHAIVEAHVRLYALLKHKDADGHPQLVSLRLLSPNDDLGGVLFLSIPTVVTHEVDMHSALSPSTSQKYRLPSGGLLLRQVDGLTGNRDDFLCPVCGETYGDMTRLYQHVQYNQLMEKKDDVPIKHSHRDTSLVKLEELHQSPVNLLELKDNLALQELLCVVEGIDPLTSGTFQALHSYTPEDICWGGRFVPCLTSTKEMKSTFVDLELFHEVEMVKGMGIEASGEEKTQEQKDDAESNGINVNFTSSTKDGTEQV